LIVDLHLKLIHFPTNLHLNLIHMVAQFHMPWFKAETTKPRKQRRNLKQLYIDLKELGYEGSFDRVAAFDSQWKPVS